MIRPRICRARLLGKTLVVLVVGAFSVEVARADIIYNFNPTNTFSGTAPTGSLQAVFHDSGTNQVTLTITSSLVGTERLQADKAIYFNYDQSNLSSLSFTLQSNSGLSAAATVLKGADAFKADGTGGFFDLLFTYNVKGNVNVLAGGQSQTYLITTSTGTLQAGDFNALSAGGNPSWQAAIHVQNTGTNGQGSGWVGSGPGPISPVPEPSSFVLMGFAGLIALGYQRLRGLNKPR